MVFSSLVFLFLYLPLVLAGYGVLVYPFQNSVRFRALSLRAGNLFLLVTSLLFYFWGEGFLVWILLASTGVDFVAGRLIDGCGWVQDKRRPVRARWFLALSLVSNLTFLGYFKYLGFGVEILRDLSGNPEAFANFRAIALPLGISFYTFQSMSYTIDVYRGNTKSTRNLLDFACYVSMFPQLVAGPIVRYVDVAKELVDRRIGLDDFVYGFRRFLVGLSKKVLLANMMAPLADFAFSQAPGDLSTSMAWLGVAAYGFQIYFDFAGYSDMAIGLGRMFGFRFPENFCYPYISRSIQEFWQRWHISLSTWFRDYLYIALGGNRRGKAMANLNIVLVFLLCGLWHGASWNFVIFGGIQGFFLVLESLFLGRWLRSAPRSVGTLYVTGVIFFSFVFFRGDNIPIAMDYLRAMVAFDSWDKLPYELLTPSRCLVFIVALVASKGWAAKFYAHCQSAVSQKGAGVAFVVRGLEALWLIFFALLCAAYLFNGASNPFIYFRF